MARRKLNSITFPDLADVYYLDADKIEFDDSATYADGSVGEALVRKANIDGYYDELTAGSAEQLISSQFVEDSEPYKFRTTGGSADVGNREEVDAIVGGTIAWNQLVRNGDFASASGWSGQSGSVSIANNIATLTVATANNAVALRNDGINGIANHVYIALAVIKPSKAGQADFYLSGGSALHRTAMTANVWNYVGGIMKPTGSTGGFNIYSNRNTVMAVNDTAQYKSVSIHDLTQMFGSTIADHIYAMEQGNAGAGVKWFKSLFPNDYYAYNAGELISVSGLQSHDTVGFNQWDGVQESGIIDLASGSYISGDGYRAKNPVKVFPNTQYCFTNLASGAGARVAIYDADMNFIEAVGSQTQTTTFTTPPNARYINFYWSDISQVCVNLSWSGWRNGEYEAYQKHSYPLDSSLTLRGIPKLSADNTMYYDGDEYAPDGTVTRNIGEYTFTGGEACANYTAWGSNHTYSVNLGVQALAGDNISILSSIYPTATFNGVLGGTENGIIIRSDRNAVYISDTSVADKTALLSKLSGTKLIYKLATPTTETAEPYTKIQTCDDFGTEEYISTSIVPVGHETRYPANLRDKLQHLPDLADSDGYYLIQQSNKQMSLIYFRIPQAPSADGTYVLKATVSGGSPTYTWVEEA